MSFQVFLRSYEQIKTFVALASRQNFDIRVGNDRQTINGKDLILSDGSTKIYFLDPQTFAVRSFKEVTLGGQPVPFINELEWINGEIWANVYTQDYILIIDPATGKVKGRVDCRGLLPAALRKPGTDVLNGIAYNPATGEIYVTGKYWPKMFKVKLVEKK